MPIELAEDVTIVDQLTDLVGKLLFRFDSVVLTSALISELLAALV